jgi:hypothetical protein
MNSATVSFRQTCSFIFPHYGDARVNRVSALCLLFQVLAGSAVVLAQGLPAMLRRSISKNRSAPSSPNTAGTATVSMRRERQGGLRLDLA